MACSVSSAAHRSQSAPVESSSSGVVAAATTTSIMLTSSGGTGSPGASTTPLHARPAASTVVDHPLRDPGGHWRPGGGDNPRRKAPDRCSNNEVSAKRSGGQSRRSALSGRPLIACHSDPTVVRCGTPASNRYSTIIPPPSTSTPVSAPASPAPPTPLPCFPQLRHLGSVVLRLCNTPHSIVLCSVEETSQIQRPWPTARICRRRCA